MPLLWPSLDAQHIYLSPHPDDAVLSCGGMIWQQARRGETIAVITLFSASPPSHQILSPFARSLHERWQRSMPPGVDFSNPPAVRRAEDQQAIKSLGRAIRVIYLPLLDCIYRHHPLTGKPLYASEESLFGLVHPADPALDGLSAAPPLPLGSTLYAPLGIGHHVDHQIVYAAVERWGLLPQQVWYYEDYPYVTVPGALEERLREGSGWSPVVVSLGQAALEAKIAAVSRYTSQISTFWYDLAEMAAALRAHTAHSGGERVWRRAGKTA
mgnify:CR=1 FL=1